MAFWQTSAAFRRNYQVSGRDYQAGAAASRHLWRMKKFIVITGLILLLAIMGQAGYMTRPPETQTLEQAAAASCLRQAASVRKLVELSREAGVSPDTLQVWEFAICTSREEAVLKEEVRRGFRRAFAPEKIQKPEQTPEEKRCPPSYWMTGDGCQKSIAAGGLSR